MSKDKKTIDQSEAAETVTYVQIYCECVRQCGPNRERKDAVIPPWEVQL